MRVAFVFSNRLEYPIQGEICESGYPSYTRKQERVLRKHQTLSALQTVVGWKIGPPTILSTDLFGAGIAAGGLAGRLNDPVR